jgi:large subunit ribosomal protein L23
MDLVQVLIKPVITEKSMSRLRGREYTFRVHRRATKKDIGRAVEKYFKVNVQRVRTINVKGKRRRVGRLRREVKLPGWKKAIVQLAPEQKIDAFDLGSEGQK